MRALHLGTAHPHPGALASPASPTTGSLAPYSSALGPGSLEDQPDRQMSQLPPEHQARQTAGSFFVHGDYTQVHVGTRLQCSHSASRPQKVRAEPLVLSLQVTMSAEADGPPSQPGKVQLVPMGCAALFSSEARAWPGPAPVCLLRSDSLCGEAVILPGETLPGCGRAKQGPGHLLSLQAAQA